MQLSHYMPLTSLWSCPRANENISRTTPSLHASCASVLIICASSCCAADGSCGLSMGFSMQSREGVFDKKKKINEYKKDCFMNMPLHKDRYIFYENFILTISKVEEKAIKARLNANKQKEEV